MYERRSKDIRYGEEDVEQSDGECALARIGTFLSPEYSHGGDAIASAGTARSPENEEHHEE